MPEYKMLKVNEIIQPEYNPRIMKESELANLDRSIKEYGFAEPIVVNVTNMHCIGGNQRLEAIKRMGIEDVLCSCISISDMTKEKELNIALNKINGEWDEEKLIELLDDPEIRDQETGFSDQEILEYLQIDESKLDEYEADEDQEIDDDQEDSDKPKSIIIIIRDIKVTMPFDTYTKMIDEMMENGLFGNDIREELKRRLLQ